MLLISKYFSDLFRYAQRCTWNYCGLQCNYFSAFKEFSFATAMFFPTKVEKNSKAQFMEEQPPAITLTSPAYKCFYLNWIILRKSECPRGHGRSKSKNWSTEASVTSGLI